jgi:predicted permease
VVTQVLATPGYLETIGIPLVAGRQFDEQDGADGRRVAIVNESFVRRFFPGQNAIGRRIRYPWKKGEWIEVVGVTRDVRHYGLDQDARPGVYIPYRQWIVPTMTLVLRTPGDPGALVAPAREALRRVDPELPMFEVTRMTEAVDRSLWARRFYSSIAVAFAAVAVLLAAGGIYGVISYRVNQRTREIGIRMALGATPARVMRGMLRDGLVMLAIGAPAGLAAMLALSRPVERLLFGVDARDPLTYAAVAAAIAIIALAANLIPALRACAIAPLDALRSE